MAVPEQGTASMLFDDKARTKLDAIIHGAAVGETVGLLASRMSEAERAEKLTVEGVAQLTHQSHLTSTSAEMLKATITGLESAETLVNPSNLEIRTRLHEAYRYWAVASPSASLFRNIRLTQTILSGEIGSFTSVENGGCDGMLMVAPIGLAFSRDPGRAFQIGAEAAALIDADFNSYLSAGVVSLLFALMEQGITIRQAVPDVLTFIRPLDWPGEISNVLRSVSDGDAAFGSYTHPACKHLDGSLRGTPETKVSPVLSYQIGVVG